MYFYGEGCFTGLVFGGNLALGDLDRSGEAKVLDLLLVFDFDLQFLTYDFHPLSKESLLGDLLKTLGWLAKELGDQDNPFWGVSQLWIESLLGGDLLKGLSSSTTMSFSTLYDF